MKHDLIYIASPYTNDDKFIKEVWVLVVSKVCAELMKEGKIIFSPIAMGHNISKTADIPSDWAYWADTCVAYLERCQALYVVMIEGWKKSTGVTAEIQIAIDMNIPIMYIDPEDYL